MVISGCVDEISHYQIQGWAFDSRRPTEKAVIRILVNGQEHGQAIANMDRPGLKEHIAGAINDAHGFCYVFSPPLSTFRSATIEVQEATTNSEISGGRKTLHAPVASRAAMTPLMVTSRGRSGTTLLMKWLVKHPDVVVADAYPYEIKLASYYASALKVLATPKPIHCNDEPDFVDHANATLQIGRNPWNSPKLLRNLGGHELERLITESVPDRLATTFRNTISDAYGTIRIAQSKLDARFFAEKCMLDEDVRYGVRSIMGDVREVVIVRDPRDFLCSAKAFWRFDTEQALQTLGNALPVYQTVRQNCDNDTMFIRYEDLIERPGSTLASVAKHFGIAPTTSRFDDTALFAIHATSRSPADSIGRWKTDLAPAEVEQCVRISKSFMEMFDYAA